MKGRDSSTGLHDLFKSQYHLLGAPQVTQGVKNLLAMQEMQVDASSILESEDALEEGMATHSSILAWRISWTG